MDTGNLQFFFRRKTQVEVFITKWRECLCWEKVMRTEAFVRTHECLKSGIEDHVRIISLFFC